MKLTVEDRRLGGSAAVAGFGCFMLLHCTQALLPEISAYYGVSAATSSLTLSAAIVGLSLSMVPLSALGIRVGRVRSVWVSLLGAGVLGIVGAASPNFTALVVVRFVQGVALGGVPALLIGYLTANASKSHLGSLIGLLISGNVLGGLFGRIVVGTVSDHYQWRFGFLSAAVGCILCAVVFRRSARREPHAQPRTAQIKRSAFAQAALSDGVPYLSLISFLSLAAFEMVFNYLGFYVVHPPLGLRADEVNWLFLAYLVGPPASMLAGYIGDKGGNKLAALLGVACTILGCWGLGCPSTPKMLIGLGLFSAGFFTINSASTGWLAARVRSKPKDISQAASSMQQVSYYVGGSVGGYLGGLIFVAHSWGGLLVAVLCIETTVAVLIITVGAQGRVQRLQAGPC